MIFFGIQLRFLLLLLFLVRGVFDMSCIVVVVQAADRGMFRHAVLLIAAGKLNFGT
jgi:hypothetical protein